jgi:hypothetical protein
VPPLQHQQPLCRRRRLLLELLVGLEIQLPQQLVAVDNNDDVPVLER